MNEGPYRAEGERVIKPDGTWLDLDANCYAQAAADMANDAYAAGLVKGRDEGPPICKCGRVMVWELCLDRVVNRTLWMCPVCRALPEVTGPEYRMPWCRCGLPATTD